MFSVIIYISAICAANLLVAKFGPAVTPINAFLLIGLDMAIRDMKHEQWQGKNLMQRMLLMICAAGILSYLINPASGIIAIASLLAFILSSTVDAAVYQLMIKRRVMIKSNASNVSGAAVDSVAFPLIAFGALTPSIVLFQFSAKIIGGIVFSMIIIKLAKLKTASNM